MSLQGILHNNYKKDDSIVCFSAKSKTLTNVNDLVT